MGNHRRPHLLKTQKTKKNILLKENQWNKRIVFMKNDDRMQTPYYPKLIKLKYKILKHSSSYTKSKVRVSVN